MALRPSGAVRSVGVAFAWAWIALNLLGIAAFAGGLVFGLYRYGVDPKGLAIVLGTACGIGLLAWANR